MVTSAFRPEVEIQPFCACAIKICNIALSYDQIAEISASSRKSWWRNTIVTSDLRAEVEIWPFRACAMHPAVNIGTVCSLWTWLWGRYHVPQNVLLVNTRSSSRDEIANVNFLYDVVVHVLQNTMDSCINSDTDRRGYVLERMFTKFSEITQYNGHFVVQGHSRSPIFVLIESPYTTSY